ncbi:MAG TPA: tRNA lysidine(34) synthetase TilS [Trueperaceae bacterium]|nr:tRNA lysidine(34) synthetase TilS [Trueperaceae bacterium]
MVRFLRLAGHAAAGHMTPAAGLLERFTARLDSLAPSGTPLVAAVSGGADSVAAALLLRAAERPFVVAHFDHRLRAGSGEDAAFVETLSESLGAPFRLGGADVARVAEAKGWNLEDAARRLRYAFLHRVLRESGGGVIVVAHTADDQAETFLLQLLRGAAFPAGMAARRGAVARPLLTERREALRDYLREASQPWRDDPTNLDLSRNRAWLRHEVIPALETRFVGVSGRLAHTAGELAAAREALEAEASRRFGGGESLDAAALAAAPAAVLRVGLAARLRALGVPASARLVSALEDAVLRSARMGTSAPPWRRDVGRGVTATVAYGRFSLGRAPEGAPDPTAVRVTSAEQLPVGVSPSVLEGHPDLVLRRRLAGDRIRLPFGSKLVSDLLIDRKVPRSDRDGLTVLAEGNEVLWVEGVAAAVGVASPGVASPGVASPGGASPSGESPSGASPSAAARSSGLARRQGEASPLGTDEHFMGLALAEARLALSSGEVPVGAVVVVDGKVVAAAHNQSESESDPTAHAEVLALRAAAKAVGDWRLEGATLYVTLEPCPMCLGATLQTHAAGLVYGATNVREGALGGVVDLAAAGWKRVPVVRGGVRAAEAAALLKRAFAAKRAASAAGATAAPVPPPEPGAGTQPSEEPQPDDSQQGGTK